MEQDLQTHLLKGMLCQEVLNDEETRKGERYSLHSALLSLFTFLCKELHASPRGSRELWLYIILISHPAAQTKIKQICSFPPKLTSMLMLDSGAQAAQPSSLQPQASLPPQQQFGVVLALQIFVYEVGQELFEDISSVLQLALQHRHDQRGHITTVPHGEAALGLQCADEG